MDTNYNTTKIAIAELYFTVALLAFIELWPKSQVYNMTSLFVAKLIFKTDILDYVFS